MTLDVYGLTANRDRPTIQAFLDAYVDQVASDDRGDEELLLKSLTPPDAVTGLDTWDSEPARSLTHIIERGLDYPRRAFTVYLESRREDVDRAILRFTTDDMLVLGLSVEDEGVEGATPESEERHAKDLLDEVMAHFHCHMGTILLESPPPENEDAFRATNGGSEAIYFKSVQ